MRCPILVFLQEIPSIKTSFYMILGEELLVFAYSTRAPVYTLKHKNSLTLSKCIKLLYPSNKFLSRLSSTKGQPFNHPKSMLWWFHLDCKRYHRDTGKTWQRVMYSTSGVQAKHENQRWSKCIKVLTLGDLIKNMKKAIHF